MILFETERLIVRHVVKADTSAMYAVYSDPIGARWVGDGRPITRAETELWIDVTRHNVSKRGYGMCTLVDRSTGKVCGFMGLVHPDNQPVAELKYSFFRSHWGRGLATEAAQAMIAYGVETFGLRELIATTAPENHASHRVLEKVGFTRGELRANDDGSRTQVFHWKA